MHYRPHKVPTLFLLPPMKLHHVYQCSPTKSLILILIDIALRSHFRYIPKNTHSTFTISTDEAQKKQQLRRAFGAEQQSLEMAKVPSQWWFIQTYLHRDIEQYTGLYIFTCSMYKLTYVCLMYVHVSMFSIFFTQEMWQFLNPENSRSNNNDDVFGSFDFKNHGLWIELLSAARLRRYCKYQPPPPTHTGTHTQREQQRQSKILSHVGGIVTTAEKCRPRNFKSVFIIFLPLSQFSHLISLSPCTYFSLQLKPHTLSGLILFNEKWEWINGRVSSECPANETEFPFDKTTRGTIKYCIYFKWLINDFKKVN